MRDVQINKGRLLETLRENQRKHNEAYQEAIVAFYEKFTALLEEAALGVRGKKLNFAAARNTAFAEYPPQGHCDEYETALKQLEYDEREIIELTAQEFSQYVLDEWGWKEQFAQSYYAHTHKFLGS